jgi:hypothetical protein
MPRIFIVASAIVHAALVLWVEVRGVATPHPMVVVDSWAGRGIEVDAVVGDDAPHAEPDAPAPPVEPRSAAATEPIVLAERALAVTGGARAAPARPHDRAVQQGAASTPNAPAEAAPPSAGGPFGAAGLPTGVRHLPKAFTRALGLASRGDPRWLSLPVGPVGEARFRLSVDAEGRLGELEYDGQTPVAELSPVLEHLLANTRLLLLAGRFSLDPTQARAGAQALRVRVEIRDAAPSDPTGDPSGLNELDYEAPNGSRPGRGSFRLNSGRRVIGWVYVE